MERNFFTYCFVATFITIFTYFLATNKIYKFEELTLRIGKVEKITNLKGRHSVNKLFISTENGNYSYSIYTSVDYVKIGDIVKIYSGKDHRGDYIAEIRTLDDKNLTRKYDYEEKKKLNDSPLIQNFWKFTLKLDIFFLIILILINFGSTELKL